MATIVLSAVGAQLGAGFGGTLLGLSGAVIGRAVGGMVGRAIDQRVLGAGSRAVETGRIDRLRIQSAGEGLAIPRVWGQMRLPGHAIWAGDLEEVSETGEAGGGGKGVPKQRVTEIGYRLSVALALCEGPILGVGRVWADGEEIAARDLAMEVHTGAEDQLPSATIEAVEGAGHAPAYRGIAYVVLPNLDLGRWGNRMPQLSFEVTKAARDGSGLSGDVRAVAMIPGTGEFALATTPVIQDLGLGETRAVNVNTPMGGTDFEASLDVMGRELPRVGSVSLVVSWFGDDLRAGACQVRPLVEPQSIDGEGMEWRAGGIGRGDAGRVPEVDGKPIYGGTPADASVIEALRAIAGSGRRAVFYPFILMTQLAGNGLPDPHGASEQAVMPWRGRIAAAAGTDGTAAAAAAVAAFFGAAAPGDFAREGERVRYEGPDEWSYRRFILHYAHLCAAAGGIDAFLIGSEMIGLTTIRDAAGGYPAVAALRRLAAEVRAILGPAVRIGYAADWTEYFGHHLGRGAVRFHLDPLWADAAIDFVGIDNYMPLADWRETEGHADAAWGHVTRESYLRANIAGGELFDWFYASAADRDGQTRTPITDGAYGEPWVWRVKDLRGWWENRHFDRPNGVRAAQPTAWVPGSKPIWFTEIGCAALDKGANQPNKFLDALSSESRLPFFSNGRRDDAMQQAYVAAIMAHFRNAANNPVSPQGVRMVDPGRIHVWCWDARPYPAFPARGDLWTDGDAWERGHWLNGRAGAVPLAAVVREICAAAEIGAVDVSGLRGLVRGYALTQGESGRAALQPLMLAHGFDAVERDGVLRFMMREAKRVASLGPEHLALTAEIDGIEMARAPDPELVGTVRLTHVETGGDYAAGTAEAMLPGDPALAVSDSEFPLLLTRAEAREAAERWLAESRIARDTARFALAPSQAHLGAGDVIDLVHARGVPARRWRIDRIERAGALTVDAVRVEPGAYRPPVAFESPRIAKRYRPPLPVWLQVLDLPLLHGDEAPHAPWLAATAAPWPGPVLVEASAVPEGGHAAIGTLRAPAVIGRTLTALPAARPGLPDRGAALWVQVKTGAFAGVSDAALLAGANAIAIGDGRGGPWEVMQVRDAVKVSPQIAPPGTWALSHRLRGQAGTDAVMPAVWPEDSVVVLLNGAVKQAALPPAARGQTRHLRYGPAARPADDASWRSQTVLIGGVGLRPLSPCHLRGADGVLTWVRRTREGGDGWAGLDVPLAETREAYRVELRRNGALLLAQTVAAPRLTVPAAIWRGGPFEAAVAQLSDAYGAGPFTRKVIHGGQ